MTGRMKPDDRSVASDGHDPDEVDVSLIRWMLSLTPDERLEVLQGFVDSIEALREPPPSQAAPPT